MPTATRIEDGYAVTTSCHDGSLVELQVADESQGKGRLWELLLSKGIHTTLDGLTSDDLRKLAAGIVSLADAIDGRGE